MTQQDPPDPVPAGRPARARWWPVVASVATCLVAGAAALAPAAVHRADSPPGAAASRQGAAAAPAGATRRPDGRICPPSTAPDPASGRGVYAIAVEAAIDPIVFKNGYNEAAGYWGVQTTGVTAKACGLLLVPSLQVVVQPEGLLFDTSRELIQQYSGDAPGAPGPVFYSAKFLPDGVATTSVTGVGAGGRLELAANTPVVLRITNGKGQQPFTCPDAKIDTRLTTRSTTTRPEGRPDGPQWTIAGSPLEGAFVGAHAEVVSNDFAIPEFPVNPPCDQGYIVNNSFSGLKQNFDPYYTGPGSGEIPAGEGQVRGTLRIVSIDEDALPVGPPATVPGTTRPTDGVIRDSCVPRPGPPYQLGVVGSFSGGGLQLSSGAAVSNIQGVFCAKGQVVPAPPDRPAATICVSVTSPDDGAQFEDVTATLNEIPGVTSVIKDVEITPQAFTALVCDDDPPGPLPLKTTIRASAVPHLFGTGCLVGPVAAQVEGQVAGELRDAVGSVTSAPLPVAPVQPAGNLCPPGLASSTNTILGLPTRSVGGLTLDLRVGLYLPSQERATTQDEAARGH